MGLFSRFCVWALRCTAKEYLHCVRDPGYRPIDSSPTHRTLPGSAVAVGKAVRQCQSHARALIGPLIGPLGAGAQFQLRATARSAASHVAQAARRLDRACRRTVRIDLKTPAVVLDGDAAAVETIGAGERLDPHRDAP